MRFPGPAALPPSFASINPAAGWHGDLPVGLSLHWQAPSLRLPPRRPWTAIAWWPPHNPRALGKRLEGRPRPHQLLFSLAIHQRGIFLRWVTFPRSQARCAKHRPPSSDSVCVVCCLPFPVQCIIESESVPFVSTQAVPVGYRSVPPHRVTPPDLTFANLEIIDPRTVGNLSWRHLPHYRRAWRASLAIGRLTLGGED